MEDNYLGRKTFFIAPDVSLLPESYLEDYLVHGYETYIIANTKDCPLADKVDAIVSTFVDSIIFFYVDSNIDSIEWPTYIKQIHEEHGDKVLMGVLYSKRPNDEIKGLMERYYLYELGLPCGCVALEYQHSKNFELIDRVMYANQASGRRKLIRAPCDENSNLRFDLYGERYKGKIQDVSLNHFSCVVGESPKEIPLYEKIENIQMQINGISFHTDAVLIMQRETENGLLYIFLFTKKGGALGLDSEINRRLRQKLYQMVTGNTKSILKVLFDKSKDDKEKQNRISAVAKERKEEENTAGGVTDKEASTIIRIQDGSDGVKLL